MVTIRTATQSDIPAIDSLLLASQLPVGGAKESVANFFVAEDKGKLVGVGGLEDCGGNVGLLRSFAVLPEYRNQGIAKQLYEQVIAHARQSGISNLYLLTTTAQDYFARFGFAAIARSKAPEAIRNTQQFRELCPDSAVLMSLWAKSGCGGCTTATGPSLTADPESNSKQKDNKPSAKTSYMSGAVNTRPLLQKSRYRYPMGRCPRSPNNAINADAQNRRFALLLKSILSLGFKRQQ